MPDKIISVLGIPINNLTKKETVQKIVELINAYKKTNEPCFVTSISRDFLIHRHNWSLTSVRNQELFHILRTSSIVTTHGKMISLLCNILNYPLREKISSRDLILPLAKALGEQNKSIFILGGDSHLIQKIVKILWDTCPGLEIVGTASPEINVKGGHVVDNDTIDKLILEQVHGVAPDVLFVSLETPKQEIWFERVKPYLRVPVTVGFGDLLCKTKKNKLLQWWNRKIVGGFKFLCMTAPLMIYHTISRVIYNLIYRVKNKRFSQNQILLFLSPEKSIAIIQLPPLIQRNDYEHLKQKIDIAFSQDIVIFDFKAVCHFDLAGIALLLVTWERSRDEKKEIYGLNMSGDIKFLLRLHRIWDLMAEDICENPKEIMARLYREGTRSLLFESLHQERNHVILTFFGQVDTHKNFDQYLKRLIPIVQGKHCLVDFTYCTYIDNGGFNFLLKLRKEVQRSGKKMKICGLAKQIEDAFEITDVTNLFQIYRSQDAALAT